MTDEDDEELTHYGVKGMRWGQTKSVEPTNPAYSSGKRASDRRQHGKRGVNRINQRLNEGKTREEAHRLEERRNAHQQRIAIGAIMTARLLIMYGPQVMAVGKDVTNLGKQASTLGKEYTIFKAQSNRDAANAASKILKIGSKAAKTPYIKPRGGVHNITTMK